MNTYRTKFWRRCPSQPDTQVCYSLEIEHSDMLMVEAIKDAVAALPDPLFHEAAADALSKTLPGRQVIKAWHHGVEIETVRP